MRILGSLYPFLFSPRYHWSRFQLSLFGLLLIYGSFFAGVYLTVTEVVFPRIFAADQTNVWTFETPGDYTYDSNLIESSSDNLQLSLNDVEETLSVANGQLASDTVNDVTADNTYYYVATDAGVDVIQQSDKTRTAYITSSGGFDTITVVNGYLYAGKDGGVWRWQVSSIGEGDSPGSARYTTSTSPALAEQDVEKIDGKYIDSKAYIAVQTSNYIHIIRKDQSDPAVVNCNDAGGSYTVDSVALAADGTVYYNMTNSGYPSMRTSGEVLAKYNAVNQVTDWACWTDADAGYGPNNWADSDGPDISRYNVTDIAVSDDTSTANSGDNTIYVSTDEGLEIIQEYQGSESSGTVKNVTIDADGSNLLSGANIQTRNGSNEGRAIDENYGNYYDSGVNYKDDWLEIDLGESKTFNKFRHIFYNADQYIGSSFKIEKSTQGTSSNLSTNATPRVSSTSGGDKDNVNDGNTNTYWIAGHATSVEPSLLELVYGSDTSVEGVDIHFWSSDSYNAVDYKIQTSTVGTSTDTTTGQTASASSTTGGSASNAIDDNNSSYWQTSNDPTEGSPQWLQVDLGSEQTIAGAHFITHSSWYPEDFEYQYSSNGTDWTTVTGSAVASNSSVGVRTTFDSAVTGRYLRLNITSAAPSGIIIYEFETFSSMFEQGTVVDRADVSGNGDRAVLHTWDPASVKAVRLRITSTGGNNQLVSEFKTYETMFDGGTATELANYSGNSDYYTSDNISSTSARYLRFYYDSSGMGSTRNLVREILLYNSSLSNLGPDRSVDASYDSTNSRMYFANDYSPSQIGQLTRVDSVLTSSPSVGTTFTDSTSRALPNRNVTSVHYISPTKMIVGTNGGGVGFIGQGYDQTLPTIAPSSSYEPSPVAAWTSFSESATKNGGSIYYQLSADGGSTWQYWDGDSWETAGASDYNGATTINSNIASLAVGGGSFKWKAFLESDGNQQVILTSVTLGYNPDGTAPTTNASSVAITGVSDGAWSASEPTITWTAGADNDGGVGLLGYCIALDEATIGSSSSLNPVTSAAALAGIDDDVSSDACPYIVTGTSLNLSAVSDLTLVDNKQYYFSIKAIDTSDNIWTGDSSGFQDLVSFKYDGTNPSNPSALSAPQDYQDALSDFTIFWATSGDNAASDSASGIKGYQYRIGSSGTWYGSSHTGDGGCSDVITTGSYTLDEDYDSLTEGENTFYLRTVDNACNTSSSNITAVLKYSGTAPTEPQNLTATPSSNTDNSYAFSWDDPATFSGQDSGLTFCYTVNVVPSTANCTFTSAGSNALTADSFATQPSTNTLYLVAKDEAGNINYNAYSSVTFTYSGSAPGIPTNADIADISVKATENWKLTISWEEPDDTGAGITSYKIYRSTDNSSFSEIASTSGEAYSDTSLTQQTYYYYVKACDSANNCGAASSTVSLYPDGKFTTAPTLLSDPEASVITTKKATISWTTNRSSDSKVAFGTTTKEYNEEEPSNSTQVTSHEINLTNLSPGTTYYYVAKWTDEDGNTGTSDEKTFTTEPPPTLKEARAESITIDSAIVKFTAKDGTKAKISYGPTTSFGGASEISTSTSETTYTFQLSELNDDTKYFYRIDLEDSEGAVYEGDVNSFTTLPRPRLSNVRLQEVAGTSQSTVRVTWESNTPISSIVTYYPANNPGQARDQVDVELLEGEHSAQISGLLPDTAYQLIVKGVDTIGNEAQSDIQTFTTATDTRPPEITNLKVEGTILGSQGDDKTAQLIVSWDTDEPSTSQVEFGEGTGSAYSQATQEDQGKTFNHLVLISGLTPAKAYHLKAVSRDEIGNQGQSVDTVTITPKATTSAFDLVIGNLSEVFGFLGGLR